jgi:hypothetical protein
MMRSASDEPTWQVPGKFGYGEAVQSAGTVVAPLLAGFTIALIGLIVDTSNKGVGHRDLALLVLMAAAAALVLAIQCSYSARQYLTTPGELEAWYPELARAEPREPGPSLSRPTTYWWMAREEQAAHANLHRRWSQRFRLAYHSGIVLVLAGLAITLIPPGYISPIRYCAIGLAALAAIAETSWITATGLSPLAELQKRDLEALQKEEIQEGHTIRAKARGAIWHIAHWRLVRALTTWAVPPYRPDFLENDPRKPASTAQTPPQGSVVTDQRRVMSNNATALNPWPLKDPQGGALSLTRVTGFGAAVVAVLTTVNKAWDRIFDPTAPHWAKPVVMISVIGGFALVAVADILARGYAAGRRGDIIPMPDGLAATYDVKGSRDLEVQVVAVRFRRTEKDSSEFLIVKPDKSTTWAGRGELDFSPQEEEAARH